MKCRDGIVLAVEKVRARVRVSGRVLFRVKMSIMIMNENIVNIIIDISLILSLLLL
jgi:hypothetical protein